MRWLVLFLPALLATAAEPARPQILGVAHIAVFASDYEKSKAFYRDFLGFEEPYSLTNADGSPSMTFFKVNEKQYIELFPEKEAKSDRLNHISLETDDAEAMRVYLASRGVKVPARVGKGRIGNSNFNVQDPEGRTVEIVQYEPDGWTVRERGKHLPATRISARMSHVGIIVTELEPEIQFYRNLLGFRETWRGSKSGSELSWVNLKVPDGTTASVAANVINPAPVTPEAPFEVSMATPNKVSCWVNVKSILSACATNRAAIVK